MSKIEWGHIIRRQQELLQGMPADHIAHGATVPIDLITRYVQGGIALELGSGTGEKGIALNRAGFAFLGIDINPEAVAAANDRGLVSFVGDACRFWSSDINLAAFTYLEGASCVLTQGLLTNVLTDTEVRQILRTADIALAPGGYLFVAEPIRFDEPGLFDEATLDVEHAGYPLRIWRDRWISRYDLNQRAGLPRGVFAVAKPTSEIKSELDWPMHYGDVYGLLLSDDLERLAKHVSKQKLIAYAERLSYRLVDWQTTVLFSRLGEPMAGGVGVFRKEYGLHIKRGELIYRYHPWYKGKTQEDRFNAQEARQRRKRSDPNYPSDFFSRLERNLPKSQQPKREYHIGDVVAKFPKRES